MMKNIKIIVFHWEISNRNKETGSLSMYISVDILKFANENK